MPGLGGKPWILLRHSGTEEKKGHFARPKELKTHNEWGGGGNTRICTEALIAGRGQTTPVKGRQKGNLNLSKEGKAIVYPVRGM